MNPYSKNKTKCLDCDSVMHLIELQEVLYEVDSQGNIFETGEYYRTGNQYLKCPVCDRTEKVEVDWNTFKVVSRDLTV